MNRELISVIVPVYNIEKYLPRSIESIISQTYQNLEIILVDVGSTDKSGQICDNYKQKDNRIVVLHEKKCGPGGARNAGIEKAHGQYIICVDGDDYVEKDYIEYLYSLLIQYKVDISACAFKKIYHPKDKLDNVKKFLVTSEAASNCNGLLFIFFNLLRYEYPLVGKKVFCLKIV